MKSVRPFIFVIVLLGLSTLVLTIMVAKGSPSSSEAESAARETYDDMLAPEISFEFPDSWNAYTKLSIDASNFTVISLSPRPLGECMECGGYFGNEAVRISIIRYPTNDIRSLTNKLPMSLDEAIAAFDEGGIVGDLARADETLPNGTLTRLTPAAVDNGRCDAPGGCQNSWEELVFVPDSNSADKGVIVLAEWRWEVPRAESREGWELIMSTLDFSRFE